MRRDRHTRRPTTGRGTHQRLLCSQRLLRYRLLRHRRRRSSPHPRRQARLKTRPRIRQRRRRRLRRRRRRQRRSRRRRHRGAQTRPHRARIQPRPQTRKRRTTATSTSPATTRSGPTHRTAEGLRKRRQRRRSRRGSAIRRTSRREVRLHVTGRALRQRCCRVGWQPGFYVSLRLARHGIARVAALRCRVCVAVYGKVGVLVVMRVPVVVILAVRVGSGSVR
ncbi:hypothetical protein BN000_05833 [Mycobacterium europaeum]|uniref:Uncharacterized protein n=1 Tax=Mycobacterium europaeum TaxID=761804 RepID=A0A0U1DV67_9MYCO|nr:hypothetical protein BN000_05833 [Mycobacterium europaeum]